MWLSDYAPTHCRSQFSWGPATHFIGFTLQNAPWGHVPSHTSSPTPLLKHLKALSTSGRNTSICESMMTTPHFSLAAVGEAVPSQSSKMVRLGGYTFGSPHSKMGTKAARAERGPRRWQEAETWVVDRMPMYSLCDTGQVVGTCWSLLAAHLGELTMGPPSQFLG